MIRETIGCIFIAASVICFVISVIGNFKFNYVLKRMHAAGIGDALALGLFVIGCVIINGLNSTSLKLLAAGLILYFSSPVSTHLLAKLEEETNDELEKECEVQK